MKQLQMLAAEYGFKHKKQMHLPYFDTHKGIYGHKFISMPIFPTPWIYIEEYLPCLQVVFVDQLVTYINTLMS